MPKPPPDHISHITDRNPKRSLCGIKDPTPITDLFHVIRHVHGRNAHYCADCVTAIGPDAHPDLIANARSIT